MKYEAEIDPSNANSSHTLMLQLVGNDKRVLDVGCSSGYLARALIAQGCTVSGVELDPEAAEEAKPILKELVVGNLEDLDLADVFGKNTFDALVFGDVLEHLKDPLSVLKGSLPLLDDGGFVVMSIPNIAHAAVRLALLKGKFEYRDLGLLDSTHLRFFTRASLEDFIRDAELVTVESLRTTAGIFDTEIPIQRSEYSPELLAAIGSEVDGRTYQFVVKAIPANSSPALRRLHQQTAEQAAEIQRLRRAMAAVQADDGGSPPMQIGLWGHFGLDDLRPALLGRILHGELTRRLPGSTIRCFAPVVTPLRIDAGQPIEPLGPWSPARAAALADELDAVVVTGPLGVSPSVYGSADSLDHLMELDAAMYRGLGARLDERCPVLAVAVERSMHGPVTPEDLAAKLSAHRYVVTSDATLGRDAGAATTAETCERADTGGWQEMPDPLILVPRLYEGEQLRHRRAYLRLMGWFPESEPVVVIEGDESLVPFAPALGRVINEIATERGARCVLLETSLLANNGSFIRAIGPHLTRPGGVVPLDAGVVDLLASIANADVFITASPGLFALAFALGCPSAGLDLQATGSFNAFVAKAGSPDSVVGKPIELAAALRQWPAEPVRAAALAVMRRDIDDHLDQVAAIIAASGMSRRASNDAPLAAVSPNARLRALEAAHDGLLRRMAAERLAFADRADSVGSVSQGEVDALRAQLAAAEDAIAAIYATRTMRVLNPAREVYGRLRAKSR